MRLSISYILLCLIALSCSDNNGRGFRSKPKALGVANQITVICEDEIWEGPVRDSIDYYLGSIYPILPRPEPLFDLRQFSPFEIKVENLRRELRTYLVCATTQDTGSNAYKLVLDHLGEEALKNKEPRLKKATDRWATGQIILYLIAPSEESLSSAVAQYFPSITEQVNQHDLKQIRAKTYIKGESHSLSDKIKAMYGTDISIPADYQLAQEEEDFLWLRKDFEDITMNLLFKTLDYKSQGQFSESEIKAVRDSLGLKYVSSTSDNSYMKVNDIDLPLFSTQRDFNGLYAFEVRGIWEMENDFMGGPFVSYLIHLPKAEKLLFVDGFILAPGQRKRDLIQQFDVIAASIKTN